MNARARWVLNSLLVLLFSVSVALAQQNASAQGRRAFAQAELDQMLAPIALYPDSLLSQILMAATYPGEVVEAARWSRRNPGLNGDHAVRAVERIDWDPSVKSLVAFPQILDMMDEKVNWTEDLGDAFLDQRAQVMDTVQYLRRKAHAAGNLGSTDQFRVELQDSTFVIELSNPEIVYMPYYNPTVVYGTWWWPAHQPVYWAPWPGYDARPGHARGFAWGPGIPVARGFFFGAPDWHRRSVTVVNVNNYYYRPPHVNPVNRPVEITRNVNVAHGEPHVWQHDGAHRRDAPYREAAWRQPAASAGAAPAVRHDFRVHDPSTNNGRGVPASVTVPVVVAQPEMRVVPNQSPAPVAVVRPAMEQRPNPANTPEAAARGTVSHGHGSPAIDGRGGSAHRPAVRVDAGSRPAERGSPQPMVAGSAARPVIERAPVSAIVPAVAHSPAAPGAPSQPTAQASASRANAEQRPNVASAASAPAGAVQRADAPSAKPREQAGRQATTSTDSAATAPSNASATQSAGNARAGGNFRHPQ